MNLLQQSIQIRKNLIHTRRDTPMLGMNEMSNLGFWANMRIDLENVYQTFIKTVVSLEINLSTLPIFLLGLS